MDIDIDELRVALKDLEARGFVELYEENSREMVRLTEMGRQFTSGEGFQAMMEKQSAKHIH